MTRSELSSDSAVYRRALGVGLVGLIALGGVIAFDGRTAHEPAPSILMRIALPHPAASLAEPKLSCEPLSDELRAQGHHECNPNDPIGLGPYAPYRNVFRGRLLVPQKGGMTEDGGVDIVIHFHGHEALRKTLVQVARGVSFVGVDLGLGSAAYTNPYQDRAGWEALIASTESVLRDQTRNPKAHLRHIALSAWSAGYGAVLEILRYAGDRIDAVVLLDGLHASTPLGMAPVVEFAKRALRGERIFVFTYSEVDPYKYASTSETAGVLLKELKLEATEVTNGKAPAGSVAPPNPGEFALARTTDVAGFHVWGYRGGDEKAHCSHIRHFEPVLRDFIEPAWQTPRMDRNVPFTPTPRSGRPVVTSGGVELELIADEARRNSPQEPPAATKFDHGSLEPTPLESETGR